MIAYVKDNMLCDPALQAEIIGRAIDGHFGDSPKAAVEALGTIDTPDRKGVPVYLRHAADGILMDWAEYVVLITRQFNPGAGLKALPGGFIDPVQEKGGAVVVENALTAALREMTEEAGVGKSVLTNAVTLPLGHRSYDRPFDIRMAWGDLPGTPIKKGDFFCVSTQGFLIGTSEDLTRLPLQAGDDATGTHVIHTSRLTSNMFGIADHLPMIRMALGVKRQQPPFPARG